VDRKENEKERERERDKTTRFDLCELRQSRERELLYRFATNLTTMICNVDYSMSHLTVSEDNMSKIIRGVSY